MHYSGVDPASAKKSVPALSKLSTGTHLFPYFEQLLRQLRRVNYRMFSEYEEGDRGQSSEDFEQLKDWFIEKADNFREE
jgi:hypothetical protein